MKKIGARIIADSICNDRRITSMIVTIPQIVVKELLRHRMFSFSSSSMRAIPFDGVLGMLKNETFVPLGWQKDHKGMQGNEYFTDPTMVEILNKQWLDSRDESILRSSLLNQSGATKQLCNRLIEPFGFAKILVTATQWDNFFDLRCPKYEMLIKNNDTIVGKEYYKSKKDFINECGVVDSLIDWRNINKSGAEIHIQDLAEKMWDAYNSNIPKQLSPGEWHIPFGENIDETKLFLAANDVEEKFKPNGLTYSKIEYYIHVAEARCARLSYANYNEEIDYVKDLKLRKKLFTDKHMSPFEHCAKAMSEEDSKKFPKAFMKMINGKTEIVIEYGWCNNFKGWISDRFLIEIN